METLVRTESAELQGGIVTFYTIGTNNKTNPIVRFIVPIKSSGLLSSIQPNRTRKNPETHNADTNNETTVVNSISTF